MPYPENFIPAEDVIAAPHPISDWIEEGQRGACNEYVADGYTGPALRLYLRRVLGLDPRKYWVERYPTADGWLIHRKEESA